VWGLEPAGYHWTNILLHAANAVLVWVLLSRINVPGAWLGAALFALHPVNVESVAWISERKNVLSLLFFLLALLQWIRFLAQPPLTQSCVSASKAVPFGSARSAFHAPYLRALLFYALALTSKSTACTLPAALLLVLWLQQKPITPKRIWQVAPFVILGLGMGLLAMWWERFHQGTSGKQFAIGWLDRILIASRAIWFYTGKLLWPANLTFSYTRWNMDPSSPLAYSGLVALVVLVWLVFKGRKYFGRSVTTAGLFYVATLSPLLGFVMLYTFRYTFVADHYQYTACIGPLALAGAGLRVLRNGAHKPANTLTAASDGSEPKPDVPAFRTFGVSIASVLIATSLGILTWQQCHMYSDAETLWRTTIARNPQSYLAHNNLGTHLLRRGHTDEAILHFNRVLELQPDYEIGHYNLGNALLQEGLTKVAINELETAIRLKPDYASAHNNLANVLLHTGRARAAVEHYEMAAKLRPKNADASNNLSWLLATSPDATIRNGPKALTFARRAEELSQGRDPVYIATLAAAYAEMGRFEEAMVTARRAQALAALQRSTGLSMALIEQVNLYAQSKPFRDTKSL
jgi:Flp pilus assembly protein TadD